MQMNLMTLIVHKLRRGPCGTGKMWSELCEALRLLLRHPTRNQALIDRYAEAVLNDRGEPRESPTSTVLYNMELMLSEGKGPVVQTRRWFTIYDSGKGFLSQP